MLCHYPSACCSFHYDNKCLCDWPQRTNLWGIIGLLYLRCFSCGEIIFAWNHGNIILIVHSYAYVHVYVYVHHSACIYEFSLNFRPLMHISSKHEVDNVYCFVMSWRFVKHQHGLWFIYLYVGRFDVLNQWQLWFWELMYGSVMQHVSWHVIGWVTCCWEYMWEYV